MAWDLPRSPTRMPLLRVDTGRARHACDERVLRSGDSDHRAHEEHALGLSIGRVLACAVMTTIGVLSACSESKEEPKPFIASAPSNEPPPAETNTPTKSDPPPPPKEPEWVW